MFGIVRARLYKYLLKRLFGRYLDEDLDSVKISADGDNLNVQNLHLKFGYDLFGSNLGVGYAKSVTIRIPWRKLQSGCQVTICGLELDINAGDCSAEDSSDEDSDSSPSGEDTYLHRALLGLFNHDFDPENIDAEIEEVPTRSHMKSVDCVSEYIHSVFRNTTIQVLEARVDILVPESNSIIFRIPSLSVHKGCLKLCNGFKVCDEHSSCFLTVNDPVLVDFNDETIVCDIDTIKGIFPIHLLFLLQRIALKITSRISVSQSVSPSEESMLAHITQTKINVRNLAVSLQSKKAQFTLSMRNLYTYFRLVPDVHLQLCSVDVAEILDEVDCTRVLSFGQNSSPVLVLSSYHLKLASMQLSLNLPTLYRFRDMAQQCALRISNFQTECSETRPAFVISLTGPNTMLYRGYFDVSIDSEIVMALKSQSGSLIIQSSRLRVRDIQQDPIILLSTGISCTTKFSYGQCSLPALLCQSSDSRRASRIFQFRDFSPIESDDLQNSMPVRNKCSDSVQLRSCWKVDHLKVYLSEHVFVGLYSAINSQARLSVPSTIRLEDIPLAWAATVDIQKVTLFYKTCSSCFTVQSLKGLSIFGSPDLLRVSLNSLLVKKGSAEILSHVSCLEGCARNRAVEFTILSKNAQREHSLFLNSIVLHAGQITLDLIEAGISLCTTVKIFRNETDPVNRFYTENRLDMFHFNFDDCAIRLLPVNPCTPQLTFAVETFRSTVSKHQLQFQLGGLSLHLVERGSAVAYDSRLNAKTTLSESLVDSGEIVIMLLDIAECDSQLNSASLNFGHITFMTSADAFILTYRAVMSCLEQICPRLSAFTTNVSPDDNGFSVSKRRDDAVLFSSNEVLLPKAASGGVPAPSALSEGTFQDLKVCPMLGKEAKWESDTEHSMASFVQESYHAVAAAKLPNHHEMKAQYLNVDFDIDDTHFTNVGDGQQRNWASPGDDKRFSGDAKDPELQFSLHVCVESLILRLFGGSFIKPKSGSVLLFDNGQPSPRPNRSYAANLSGFIEEEFISLRKSVFGNGYHQQETASDLIEIVFGGLQFLCRSYSSSSEHPDSHKFDGTLANIIINDHVKESHFPRVIGPLIVKRHPRARDLCTKALVVTIESVKSASYCAEHRAEVQLGPLDVTLDGATLAFALEFASGIESVLEPVVATPLEGELDTVQVQVNLDPTVYLHFFECDATCLNVTYRPANSDFSSIQNSADYVRLLQMLPIHNARFDLKRVSLRGLSGYTRAFSEMVQFWIRDIARNQYHRYLTSIVPFASVMKVATTVRESIEKWRNY